MSKSLSPRMLTRDFGHHTPLAQTLVAHLVQLAPETHPAYQSWLERFRLLTGWEQRQDRVKLHGLLSAFRLEAPIIAPDASQADHQLLPIFFAVQTYYALILKLLSHQVLGLAMPPMTLHDLTQMESGQTFQERGINNLITPNPYAWYLDHWDERLHDDLLAMGHLIAAYEQRSQHPNALKALYLDLVPRDLRYSLGEYYTPNWLATYVLNALGYDGHHRLLDPTCGSGTFLVMALERACTQMDVSACLDHIVGFDLNPLAVLMARLNLLLIVGETLDEIMPLHLPIYEADMLLTAPEVAPFTYVVGNPPWLNWEHLPAPYREKTRSLWKRYGLFPARGMEAILGKGKKDLALLMTYAASDHFLDEGGKLGVIITQSALKGGGVGDRFRHFHLTTSDKPLSVQRVDDMSAVQPFERAMTRSVTLVLEKGQPTEYPVPYHFWHKTVKGKSLYENESLANILAKSERYPFVAAPITADEPTSPWLTGAPAALSAVQQLLGPSPYEAHAGAYTGGANAVYWLEVLARHDDGTITVRNIVEGAKRNVPQVEARLESDLIYPLLRGRDVQRWRALPTAHLLVVQDPQERRGYDETWLEAHYPLTMAYLRGFEAVLRQRAAYRRYFKESDPFYSMFDIGAYTFAPVKVVWQGFGVREMRAAAVLAGTDKPVMTNQAMHPAISLGLDPACPGLGALDAEHPERRYYEDEAHYISAAMNSAPFAFAVMSHTQVGSKSFAQPGILNSLRLLRYDAGDERHQQLAQLAREAHDATDDAVLKALEGDIDRVAGQLWGVAEHQLDDVRESLTQLSHR